MRSTSYISQNSHSRIRPSKSDQKVKPTKIELKNCQNPSKMNNQNWLNDIKCFKSSHKKECGKKSKSSKNEDISCKKVKLLKLVSSNSSKCACCCAASETFVIIKSSSDSNIARKGNIPVEFCDYIDEMLCLCECINIKGFNVSDEPDMKSITYEELYKMKIFKSKNVDLAQVCFLARKHGFIQFNGSCLNLPSDKFLTIFLIKRITSIRKILSSMEPNDSFVEEVEEHSEWYNDDRERNVQESSVSGQCQEPINQERFPQTNPKCSTSQRLQILITCKENDEKNDQPNPTINPINVDHGRCNQECKSCQYRNLEQVSNKSESDDHFSSSCHGIQVLITCKKDEDIDRNNSIGNEYCCLCDRSKVLNQRKSRTF